LGAITWEIDDKLIEEPVKDENGNPTLDGETKLTQSIKISMNLFDLHFDLLNYILILHYFSKKAHFNVYFFV